MKCCPRDGIAMSAARGCSPRTRGEHQRQRRNEQDQSDIRLRFAVAAGERGHQRHQGRPERHERQAREHDPHRNPRAEVRAHAEALEPDERSEIAKAVTVSASDSVM